MSDESSISKSSNHSQCLWLIDDKTEDDYERCKLYSSIPRPLTQFNPIIAL